MPLSSILEKPGPKRRYPRLRELVLFILTIFGATWLSDLLEDAFNFNKMAVICVYVLSLNLGCRYLNFPPFSWFSDLFRDRDER